MVNRKVDGNPGKISKLTINCYHTASKILVNGSKVDLFLSEGLPLVKQHISHFCTDLSDLNQLFERTLQACNSMKANQTTDKTNIMSVENGTDREPTLEQSLFFCPTCEEVADQQTIGCESCDSWYHYGCAGITVNDVSKISPEVPFICENCNEGLIYGDCQVEKENQTQDHKQNSILNSPQAGNCVTPQQESEVNVQVLASEPLQDNTVKSSGTASGVNDTCNLNTPIVKNNKRKGDNKTNTGAAKSKRNQNSDHDQTNVHQAQNIQRLELKIKELQSSVSVMKQRDQLLSSNTPNEETSDNCGRNSQNSKQYEATSNGCHSALNHHNNNQNCYIQSLEMRIKQLETTMFQNLYIMTMGGTQTNLQIQQQANVLHNLQIQQMNLLNSFFTPRPAPSTIGFGNPHYMPPYPNFVYPNL